MEGNITSDYGTQEVISTRGNVMSIEGNAEMNAGPCGRQLIIAFIVHAA